MSAPQKAFLYILFAVGLIASLVALSGRMSVERSNVTVGVAVDFLEVEQLAGATGGTLENIMTQLRSAGATHLAISEDSLQSLVDRGQASIYGDGRRARIWVESTHRLQQVANALSARFPGSYTREEGDEGDFWLGVPAVATSLPAAGVGYPREALLAAESVGLEIVARPLWQGIRTQPAVDASMRLASEIGAKIVIFNGDQVVGFPGLIKATADSIRQYHLTYGYIELAPQNGAAALASKLDYEIVRVHSITEPEMRTISLTRAVERFVKAARERNVRLFYMRLFPNDGRGPARINVDYLAAVQAGLVARGLMAGTPGLFPDLNTPTLLLVLIRLGVCAAVLWLVQSLFGLRAKWFWALAAVLVLGGGAAMMAKPDAIRGLCALGAAVAYPVLAVCWAARFLSSPGRSDRTSLGSLIPRQLIAFVGISLVTVVGGLVVAALLSDSAYIMKIAQFRGVKFAQMLPLVVVALLWLARELPEYRERLAGARGGEWPGIWAGLRGALGRPILYWHAVVAMVGLVALALLLVRSGNEAGSAVLPFELQFRALLDRVLVVRPRTKEVFIGHPMMMLALLLALRRTPKGIWIAFALGTVGQVSLLNTFCHLHTPLSLTLLRVFNGLWVGAIVGIVLCVVWNIVSGYIAPRSAPEKAGDAE